MKKFLHSAVSFPSSFCFSCERCPHLACEIWKKCQGDTHTHTVPAYKTAQMSGRRSGRHTHTHSPCLQDRADVRSPVRETHTYTQSLPTRPHRCQVAGQGDTHIHTVPAYKTAQMSGRRSGRHTHTHTYTHTHTHSPCLQDRTDVRSPVRKTHTHTPSPCLQDRADVWSPVRETHTYTQSLPTRPHRCQVAGQGDTHTHTVPAYKTAQMSGHRSGKHTHTQHNTQSLPTRLKTDLSPTWRTWRDFYSTADGINRCLR